MAGPGRTCGAGRWLGSPAVRRPRCASDRYLRARSRASLRAARGRARRRAGTGGNLRPVLGSCRSCREPWRCGGKGGGLGAGRKPEAARAPAAHASPARRARRTCPPLDCTRRNAIARRAGRRADGDAAWHHRPLEHCAKKWEPVFRTSDATTNIYRKQRDSDFTLLAIGYAGVDGGSAVMNRAVLGALVALALVGIGLFWLQGRAAVERGAPP